MKIKLLFTLAVLCAGLARGQIDARTRAYINAVLGDSVTVMKEIVKDTAAAVRSTVRGDVRDTVNVYWADSMPTIRGEMIDSAAAVWVDSAVVALRKNGTVALTGNWAAGDFDITGLNRVEADSVEATPIVTGKITTGAIPGTLDLTEASFLNAAPITTDSVDAQHIVADVHIQADSANINNLIVTEVFALPNAFIGDEVFAATKTADTVLVSGLTVKGRVFIQPVGPIVPVSPYTVVVKVDSFIVNCAVGDTAVATSQGYYWLRVRSP